MRKLVACLIAVSLVLGIGMSHVAMLEADAHAANAVAQAADLAVAPRQDDCPKMTGGGDQHSHDAGACKKWCAACAIAAASEAPSAEPVLPRAAERLPMRETTMVARAVPTEPGIPKTP